jgi:hypothetical protein
MTIIPAASGAFFTANLEQVPTDVAGYSADRSAAHLPIDPSLQKVTVAGAALALVAAELGAVPTERMSGAS